MVCSLENKLRTRTWFFVHIDYIEARLILLGKMGYHNSTLELYMYRLCNYNNAEWHANLCLWSDLQLFTKSDCSQGSYVSSTIPPFPLQYSIMFLIKLIKYIKFYNEEHYILFNKMPERKARNYFNTFYMILLCFPLTKYGTNIKTISLNKMVTLCYNQVKNLPLRIMLAYFWMPSSYFLMKYLGR